jgi:hypothetical protein
MTTPEEIYAYEYTECGCRTHEERHHWAQRAVDLEHSRCAGRMKCDSRPRGSCGGRPNTSKPHDRPANADALRDAAEAAACAYFGISLAAIRMGQSGRPRWWIATALASIPGGGRPGIRNGVIGGKGAQLILESASELQWTSGKLQAADREAYRAAVAFGATLVVKWGTQ